MEKGLAIPPRIWSKVLIEARGSPRALAPKNSGSPRAGLAAPRQCPQNSPSSWRAPSLSGPRLGLSHTAASPRRSSPKKTELIFPLVLNTEQRHARYTNIPSRTNPAIEESGSYASGKLVHGSVATIRGTLNQLDLFSRGILYLHFASTQHRTHLGGSSHSGPAVSIRDEAALPSNQPLARRFSHHSPMAWTAIQQIPGQRRVGVATGQEQLLHLRPA